MPADIKLSRVPYQVMIDAVMRRMVHTHYKEISGAYELCRRSQELNCDLCTAGGSKNFLVLQGKMYILLEAHWYPQLATGFVYGDLCNRAALAPWPCGRYVPINNVLTRSIQYVQYIPYGGQLLNGQRKSSAEFINYQDAHQQAILR